MNGLPVYENNMKYEFYTCFWVLNVLDDNLDSETFTIISIALLVFHEKKDCVQVYLHNCACKIVGIQMMDYLDDDSIDLIGGIYRQ